MLTKQQYKVLLQYKDAPVPVGNDGLSETEQYLLAQGFIEQDEWCVLPGKYSDITSVHSHKITETGRIALDEYKRKRSSVFFQIFLIFLGSGLTLLIELIISLFH